MPFIPVKDKAVRNFYVIGPPKIIDNSRLPSDRVEVKIKSEAEKVKLKIDDADEVDCQKSKGSEYFSCIADIHNKFLVTLRAVDNLGQSTSVDDTIPPMISKVRVVNERSENGKKYVTVKFKVEDKESGIEKIWMRSKSENGYENEINVRGFSDQCSNNKKPIHEAEPEQDIEVSSLDNYEIFIWANDCLINKRKWKEGEPDYKKYTPKISWSNQTKFISRRNSSYSWRGYVFEVKAKVEAWAPKFQANVSVPGTSLSSYLSCLSIKEGKYDCSDKITIKEEKESRGLVPEGTHKLHLSVKPDTFNKSKQVYTIIVDMHWPYIKDYKKNKIFSARERSVKFDVTVADDVSGVGDIWLRWGHEKHWKPNGDGVKISGNNSNPEGLKCTLNELAAGKEKQVTCKLSTDQLDTSGEIQLWASDKAGNDTGWLMIGKYEVDKTPPTLSLTAPQEGDILVSDKLAVTGTVQDEHPDHVELTLYEKDSAGKWVQSKRKTATANINKKGEFSYNFDSLEPRDYKLCALAYDEAGNKSEETCVTVKGKVAPEKLFKNFNLSVRDGSLEDRDHSGGYSAGDAFEYLVSFDVIGEARAVSMTYDLPEGLEKNPDKKAEILSPIESKSTLPWTGRKREKLLEKRDFHKDSKVIVSVPVMVGKSVSKAALISTIELAASNATEALKAAHTLDLQTRIVAAAGLQLTFERDKPEQQVYRKLDELVYQVTLTALSWDLKDVVLRYAVPAGLEPKKEKVERKPADVEVKWDDRQRLRVSVKELKKLERLTITIPLGVREPVLPGAWIRSTVKVEAANMSGVMQASDQIQIEGEPQKREGLRLTLERVQKEMSRDQARGAPTGESSRAAPGETIEFKLTYQNLRAEPLHKVVIYQPLDAAYEGVVAAWCADSALEGGTCCVESKKKTNDCQKRVKEPGQLRWRLGTLGAGVSGALGYQVKIRQ